MKRYKKMTTDELDALLQAELRKDTPDEEVVLPILKVLEERERGPHKTNRWIISLASIAAALALLIMVVPKAVGASSFWDAVLCVTDSVVQFFTPGEDSEAGYVFETDNPGLQQLYDKVVELGITDPIVPMWLPNGYELTEIKESSSRGYKKILSVYMNGSDSIVIMYKISGEISTTQYEWKRELVEVYEAGRRNHAIIKNADNWTVTWVVNNVECFITADLELEDIYKIIDSIYGSGFN